MTDSTLGAITENLNRIRVPLSGIVRKQRPGPYRYFGAQGVIDHIDDYIFDGEYLLVAEDGENLRSRKQPIASLVSGKFWVNNHAHILKVDETLANSTFVLHAVNQAPLAGLVTGAAQPKLTKANLERLPIPAIAKAEQDRIAAVLAGFDELIAINQRRVEVLEQLARSLYREWFIRFRFPGAGGEHNPSTAWDLTDLGAIAKWFSGGTPSTRNEDFWDGGIPWITSGSLRSALLSSSGRTLTPAGVAAGSRMVDRDAVLFVVRGMSLMREVRAGIAERAIAFGQDCKALVAVDGVEPLFLAFTVLDRQETMHGMVELAGHGTGKLSTDRVKALPVCVPPTGIQQAFVAAVAPLRDSMSAAMTAVDILTTTRDLLLPRLVTGRLDKADLDLGDLIDVEAA